MTVSVRPPAMTMPVPGGPSEAEPVLGTETLLLSCTKLFVNIQQECEPVGPVPPLGQTPSCGDGASSLFWLFVLTPVLFWSNSEFRMTRLPPEFVPEYPSAENCACASSSTVL